MRARLRGRLLACAILGASLGVVASAWAQATGPRFRHADTHCPRPDATPDTIAAISPRGELALASGRVARLAGLRAEDDEGALRAQTTHLSAHRDAPVTVAASAAPDRWGRHTADIVRTDRALPLDLAQDLVAAGLARVEAGAHDVLCQPELLALEETARERGLGLWAQEGFRPVPAGEGARLRALDGRFVLVEGRVRSVGERARRTYLNFGADFAQDFAVTIPKQAWTRMTSRGLTAAGLRGRVVRARGVVEVWRGPVMEIRSADMLEVVEPKRPRPLKNDAGFDDRPATRGGR